MINIPDLNFIPLMTLKLLTVLLLNTTFVPHRPHFETEVEKHQFWPSVTEVFVTHGTPPLSKDSMNTKCSWL